MVRQNGALKAAPDPKRFGQMKCDMTMIGRKVALWVLAAPLVLAACDPASLSPREERPEPGVLNATRNGPPGAPEGTCWGKTVSPAVIETVVRQIQIKPAKVNADGTVAAPPKYRTEESQEIVSPRRDNWFETPCDEVLTEEFISTLQRALLVRGYYAGKITGRMDLATYFAVKSYQRAEGGPDSRVLSLEAARNLGLIAVPRSPSD